MKKVIFALVAIMGLMLVACTPNKPIDPTQTNDDLYQYKYEAMTEVNDYMIAAYAKDKYSQEDGEDLIEILNDFMAKLKTCEDKATIDDLKSKAKVEIDKILEPLIRGQFLTLQEAYYNGYITKDDLNKIAKSDGDTSAISKDIDRSIRYTKLVEFKDFTCKFYGIDINDINEITIEKYYGEYNGYYVVCLFDKIINASSSDCFFTSIIIDGIKVNCNYPIMVWSKEIRQQEPPKGRLYSFEEAYENGSLTIDDLQNIKNGVYYSRDLAYCVITPNVRKAIEDSYRETYNYSEYVDVYVDSLRGFYNGAYVVTLSDSASQSPGISYDINVGGFDFSFGHIPDVFVLE